MKSRNFIFFFLSVLVACDGSNSPNGAIPAPIPLGLDSAKMHNINYSAELSEGIVFAKEGYPSFISDVSGVSNGISAWGRWTDSATSTFKFKIKLPAKIRVILEVFPAQSLANKAVVMRVGAEERSFEVGSALESQTFQLDFNNQDQSDEISLMMRDAKSPHELDPSNQDLRVLGLGLIKLAVLPN